MCAFLTRVSTFGVGFTSPLKPRNRSFLLGSSKTSVVLTREAGSNERVRKMLESYDLNLIELPLIQFNTRPESEMLVELLKTRRPDWVTLTSPQSARVFLQAWEAANRPLITIATFKGTKKVLTETTSSNLRIGFISEVSNADYLAETLPQTGDGVVQEVWYPASSKADDVLERGLRNRHFIVTRLDTYETTAVPLERLDSANLERARSADILTFASPTAVNAWIGLSPVNDLTKPVACIGSTTAKRARKLGFNNVYFSENPGLEGLVHSIVSIAMELGKPITQTVT